MRTILRSPLDAARVRLESSYVATVLLEEAERHIAISHALLSTTRFEF